MKPKFYPLLQQCVEVGITRGYNMATKHNEEPPQSYIEECIYNCIMGELHEWFDFPWENNDNVS